MPLGASISVNFFDVDSEQKFNPDTAWFMNVTGFPTKGGLYSAPDYSYPMNDSYSTTGAQAAGTIFMYFSVDPNIYGEYLVCTCRV